MTLEKRVEILEKKWSYDHPTIGPVKKNEKRSDFPQFIELEIIWPERDVGGLHFNWQKTKGLFNLTNDGWYHSFDILFMSARSIIIDNRRDILSEYVSGGHVQDAFCCALMRSGIYKDSSSITVSLPKQGEGVKKYNGIECNYWIKPIHKSDNRYFQYIDSSGCVDDNNPTLVYGCAPMFRIKGD